MHQKYTRVSLHFITLRPRFTAYAAAAACV